MQKALTLYDTTIGKKAVMALSGLVLFGFVIGHMIGNLQVFAGPEKLNAYAAFLKGTPALLWGTRIVLVAAVLAHIATSAQLWSRSNEAKAGGYRVKKTRATNYAALTMMLSGPIVLLFIIFHLAHFTYPGLGLGAAEFSHTDVYSNVVSSFRVPWVAGIYIVANLLLGFHLHHGAWSLFQSLGLSHPRYDDKRKNLARGLATFVVAGNVIMPLAVLTGIVK